MYIEMVVVNNDILLYLLLYLNILCKNTQIILSCRYLKKVVYTYNILYIIT